MSATRKNPVTANHTFLSRLLPQFSGGKRHPNPRRNRLRQIERLEHRELMAADFGAGALIGAEPFEFVPDPTDVPAYSSNPGAEATVYLDFNGHDEGWWGVYRNARTPAFNLDGVEGFSLDERNVIKEVWQHVAEDFAPFDINVTTVNPGDFSNGKAVRVAIGGSCDDWLGKPAGGIAYLGSFTNFMSNTVFVFQEELGGGAKSMADAASHEAGHAFGLMHQSLFNADGEMVDEYRKGTSAKGPLMGDSYESQRSTWAYGTIEDPIWGGSEIQDDMYVIASSRNGFGYRADDHGNNFGSATSLIKAPINKQFLDQPVSFGQRSGIIAKTSDSDWFKLEVTTSGTVSFQANVAAVGANLDAKLSLVRVVRVPTPGGAQYVTQTIAVSDSASSLNASVTAQVAAGTYYVVVGSHGEYGDVGQYKLQGNFTATPTAGSGGAFIASASSQPSLLPATIPSTMVANTSGSLQSVLPAGSTLPLTMALPSSTRGGYSAADVDRVMGTGLTPKFTSRFADAIDLLATEHVLGLSASRL